IIDDHLDIERWLRRSPRSRHATAARRGLTDRSGVALLYERDDRQAEGGGADAPQPALYEPLLLRRHRRARRARHLPPCRSVVARRRALRSAAFAAGRAPGG